jgi:small subunit ribosomal protein S2
MERLPGAVLVIDPKREELLVKEANRLKIPVVALTDTNCDPEVVDYLIPGNDDAIRSISLISRLVADAIVEGRGEEALPTDGRPLPPVVEEAQQIPEEDIDEGARDALNGRAEEALPEGPASEVGRVEDASAEDIEAPPPEAPEPEEQKPETPENGEPETAEPEAAGESEPRDPEAAEPEAAAEPEVGEPEAGEPEGDGAQSSEAENEETEEK